jgi:hypothetical protein
MALAGGQVSDPALENRSFTSGRRWRRGGLFDPERDHAGAAATLGGTVRSEARERTGQRPVAEHGAALQMPELRRILAADCRRMIAGHVHDVCGVHLPQLSGVTVTPGQ